MLAINNHGMDLLTFNQSYYNSELKSKHCLSFAVLYDFCLSDAKHWFQIGASFESVVITTGFCCCCFFEI